MPYRLRKGTLFEPHHDGPRRTQGQGRQNSDIQRLGREEAKMSRECTDRDRGLLERGVPGFDAVGWTMICAPSATPKPAIDRLHAELKAVAATRVIVRIGTIPVDSPPPTELQRSTAGAA
jgi:hypothetical protein